MDWKTASHELKFPVEMEGSKVTKITLREPDVEALEAIDELGIEPGKPMRIKHIRGIIETLGDAPAGTIGKLHRTDIAALGELLGPLLEDPETEEATTEAP